MCTLGNIMGGIKRSQVVGCEREREDMNEEEDMDRIAKTDTHILQRRDGMCIMLIVLNMLTHTHTHTHTHTRVHREGWLTQWYHYLPHHLIFQSGSSYLVDHFRKRLCSH